MEGFFRKSIYTDSEFRRSRSRAKKLQEPRYERNPSTVSGLSPVSRTVIGNPDEMEKFQEGLVRKKLKQSIFSGLCLMRRDPTSQNLDQICSKIMKKSDKFATENRAKLLESAA